VQRQVLAFLQHARGLGPGAALEEVEGGQARCGLLAQWSEDRRGWRMAQWAEKEVVSRGLAGA
jgi:hypothetical protein